MLNVLGCQIPKFNIHHLNKESQEKREVVLPDVQRICKLLCLITFKICFQKSANSRIKKNEYFLHFFL